MTKHNKKRNIGIIYELFLKHMSNCLIENDITSLKKATKILEKRFSKGTELYKEFRLFNALAKTTASDTHIVASILTEAKAAARATNKIKLEKEKSDLIRDINYRINDKQFYYRSIDNYRDLATIQIMLNEWRLSPKIANIQRLIEFEKKVGESLLKEKNIVNLDDEKRRLDASDSNRLVFKIMTEKLNKKYGNTFSNDEKLIIKNYAIYSDNHDYLKEFFSDKKKEVLILLENFEDVEKNNFIVKKVESVREKIDNLNINEINDSVVIKFLTLTKLITELKSEV